MSIETTSLPPEIPAELILDGLTFLSEPAIDQWRHEYTEPAPYFLRRFVDREADPKLFNGLTDVLHAHSPAEMDEATWRQSGDSFKEQAALTIVKARGIGHALKPESDIEAHEWLLEGSRQRLAVLSVQLASRRNPEGKRAAALREEFERVADTYWDIQCRMAERELRDAQARPLDATQRHLRAYRLASGEFQKLTHAQDAVLAWQQRRLGRHTLAAINPNALSRRVDFNNIDTTDGSLEAVRETFQRVLATADQITEARILR